MFRLLRKQRNESVPAKPRRKWRRRLAVIGVLLLLVIWFAPAIAVHTGLLNALVSKAGSDLKGSVRVGGASLSWFSPVELRDIEVRDEHGQLVLRVASIRSSRSLLGLLRDSSELGDVRIDQAAATIRCTGNTSNIEGALARYLEKPPAPGGSGGAAMAGRLELTNAHIEIEDADTQQKWILDPLRATAVLSKDPKAPVTLQFEAASPTGQGECRVAVDASIAGKTTANLQASGFPLKLLEPFLRRVEPGIQLDGIAHARLNIESDENAALSIDGDFGGSRIVYSGARLYGDRLTLQKLEMPCRLRTEAGRIVIEQASVTCDLGTASVKGSFDPNLPNTVGQGGLTATLDVDLARTASMLPKTIALKAGTSISSGRLTASLTGEKRGSEMHWQGKLAAAGIKGKRDGRPLAWEQPVSADFAIRLPDNGTPAVDRLHCESDFLTADVAGTEQKLTADLRFDLDKLTERLGQFVDMRSLKLAGSGSAQLTALRGVKDAFRLQGNAELRKLFVAGLTAHPLQENEVVVRIDVVGTATANGPIRLGSGGCTIQAGADGIGIYLVEPLPDLLELDSRGVARVRLVGDVTRWRDRLRPLLPDLDSVQAAGVADLSGVLRYEPGALTIDTPKATLRDFHFRALGLFLDEPNLEIRAASAASRGNVTQLSDFALTTSTIAMVSQSLKFNGGEISGTASVQGDLTRLQAWFANPGAKAAGHALRGGFIGSVTFSSSVGRTGAFLNLEIKDALVGPPASPAWREPRVKCTGKVEYDERAAALRLTELRVEGTGLTLTANGTISDLSKRQELTLDGQLTYDLAKLEPQLRPLLGSGVKLRGQATRPIQVRGPLGSIDAKSVVLAHLTGEAGLTWDGLQTLGCDVGPVEFKGRLRDGWIAFDPIAGNLNGGKLKLEPTLRLEPGPMALFINKGTIIDHARVSPAMCADALGFIAPLLADVAEAEGELSVQLDPSMVPFGDMNKATVPGRLVLHSVKVGPGPLLRELSVLVKGTSTLQLAKESAVPFHFVNGRVHHQNLTLTFPDTWVRTNGSVGLDGSLDLVVETPVPQKWLGKNALAPALAKQTIKLPIRGTLSQPKLNEQALRREFERFAKDAARDTLLGELENRLKGALIPKK